MKLTDEQIAKLKQDHGDVTLLEHQGEGVVVKTPNRAVWKRFRAQVIDESKRTIAMEELLRACTVHPDRTELEAMLDRKPGLAETFGKELAVLAGAGDGVAEKKAL